MGRSQVDAAIMEEVLADRDVESLQRTSTSHGMISGAVTPRPVLTVYPPQKNWSVGRWSVATASASACLAIVAGLFFLSSNRIERSIQKTSQTWASLKDSAPFGQSYTAMKPPLVSQSSVLNDPVAEVPKSGAGQFSAQTEDAGINAVVVQPGDTMRKIILRTLGEYNGATIAQVRKLNPAIANLDFLAPGETVQLPLSLTLNTLPVHIDKTAADGSGREMSRGE